MTEALVAIVVAQAIATLVHLLRRRSSRCGGSRRGAARPLGEDVPGIRSFVLQSSVATGVISLRTTLVPLILGVVAGPTQVGLFRIAQTPQTGLAAASSPARLVLMTEQTRDWEQRRAQAHPRRDPQLHEVGRGADAGRGAGLLPRDAVARRASCSATSTTGAVTAARIVLLAAAIQFAIGWTKSLPVTIGRPQLRIVTHGLETLVAIPLVAVLGAEWGATGAAVAVLASTLVFAAAWLVVLVRLRDEVHAADPALARCRCSREGRRRLRDLAARPGRPREPRAGARGLPRRARTCGRGRHDRGRRSRADARTPCTWARASLPAPARCALRCSFGAAARRADVVYATSMIRRAAIGARLARRPLVVKLVSDEVFERAARERAVRGDARRVPARRGEARGGGSCARRATRLSVARATSSARARTCATWRSRWGLDPERVSVLPNPAPELPELPSRDELRAELGFDGTTLVFAGRLGPQKSLDVALEALVDVPDVTLAVAGDGPERSALERRVGELGLDGRVRFLGSVPRASVLRLFRAADASVLPSAWENFPHTVVEALAVGCPVIATAVGGVPEVVRDGENGLLVPPGDPAALAAAIARFFADERAPRAARRRGRRPPSRGTPRRPSSRRSRRSSSGRRA